VLENQLAIGLTEPQITSIKKLLNETHSRTLDIETDLRRAVEKLKQAIAPPRVDEGAALGLADQVLRLETEMKKVQLGMLIRLKSLLTEEQQAKLRELRPKPQRPQRSGPA
jgi:Spy/CpxP family protein refolding chaperone